MGPGKEQRNAAVADADESSQLDLPPLRSPDEARSSSGDELLDLIRFVLSRSDRVPWGTMEVLREEAARRRTQLYASRNSFPAEAAAGVREDVSSSSLPFTSTGATPTPAALAASHAPRHTSDRGHAATCEALERLARVLTDYDAAWTMQMHSRRARSDRRRARMLHWCLHEAKLDTESIVAVCEYAL